MANSNKKQIKSCSHNREVITYLRPKIHMMFIADTKLKIRSKSSLADDIICKYYESLSEKHQCELINEYNRIISLKKAI